MLIKARHIWLTTWKTCSRISEKTIKLFLVKCLAMEHGQLLPHAVLALAECADPSSHGCHMLADGEVDPLDECCVDLPAERRQHLIDGLQSPEHHAMCHGH